MHLQIPQIQIDSETTLGILGKDHIRRSYPPFETTLVHFILRANSGDARSQDIEHELGCKLAFLFPVSEGSPCILLFSLEIKGQLRNPKGFLRGIAHRIKKSHVQADRDWQQISEWVEQRHAQQSH